MPVCLLSEKLGKYLAEEDGLRFLETLPACAVLVLAGRYRTGKSFLLNRLVGAKVFATGSTVKACTKGIWAHDELVCIEGRPTLILDTEGTGSMEASVEHDNKLLSVATMLASLFLFNSVGAVDEGSLSDIALIARCTASLARSAAEQWESPELLWVLRDFSLIIEDEEGALSQDEYLERCLAESDKGEARAQLMSFYPRRTLLTLVRPVMDEGRLRNASSLRDDQLRPEFLEQLAALRGAVARRLQPKRIGGHEVTGSVLAEMCRQCAMALNAGAVPSVKDAFTFLLERELSDALEAAEQCLAEQAQALRLPCSSVQLQRPVAPEQLGSLRVRFEEAVAARACELETGLARRNDDARASWLRERLQRLELGEEAAQRFLAEAPGSLGLPVAFEAVGLVLDACQTRSRSEAQHELGGLRTELEQLLLQEAKPLDDEAGQALEAERLHSAALTRELSEALTARMSTERECARLAELTQERPPSPEPQPVKDDELLQTQAEAEALGAALREQEAFEAQRLGEVRLEMMELVQGARQRFEEQEQEALHEQRQRSEDEARASLGQLQRNNEQVRSELQAAMVAHEAKVQAMSVRQTQLLLEQAQQNRGVQEAAASELRDARSKATTARHANARLEVEHECQKRALAASVADVQQVTKLQRRSEELAEKLAARDSAARSLDALLQDARRRNSSLETRLREQQTSHVNEMRVRDYKLALLEVQSTISGRPAA